jgi:hypothetical protein
MEIQAEPLCTINAVQAVTGQEKSRSWKRAAPTDRYQVRNATSLTRKRRAGRILRLRVRLVSVKHFAARCMILMHATGKEHTAIIELISGVVK